MTRKRGDVRADGYMFWAYSKDYSKKRGLYLREKWYHPEIYAKHVEFVKEYRKTWKPALSRRVMNAMA